MVEERQLERLWIRCIWGHHGLGLATTPTSRTITKCAEIIKMSLNRPSIVYQLRIITGTYLHRGYLIMTVYSVDSVSIIFFRKASLLLYFIKWDTSTFATLKYSSTNPLCVQLYIKPLLYRVVTGAGEAPRGKKIANVRKKVMCVCERACLCGRMNPFS